jgi:hypothetical protein
VNALHNWYCRSKRWRRMASDRLVPWALKGVPLGQSVLELGPGPGATTEALLQRGHQLTAAELDAVLSQPSSSTGRTSKPAQSGNCSRIRHATTSTVMSSFRTSPFYRALTAVSHQIRTSGMGERSFARRLCSDCGARGILVGCRTFALWSCRERPVRGSRRSRRPSRTAFSFHC